MKNEAENIEDLLVKHLAGETSADENQQVLAWLELAENRKEFEGMKAAWDMSEGESIAPEVDVDMAWDKLQNRIKEAKDAPVVRNINEAPGYNQSKTNWFLRIAAILVPAVLVTLLVWQGGKNNVEQKTLASGDKRIEQTLPDGSVIYLAPNSSFEYPSVFDNDLRKVKLTGEAFFEIKRDTTRPFSIALEGAEVRVLGTSFNVKAFSKEKTEVVVETGRVLFSAVNKVELQKGDKGSMGASGEIVKSKTDEAEFYSRKTRTLVFEKTEMKKVVEVLNSIYETKLTLENENIGNCRLTATFRDKDVNSILEVIAETLNLTISSDGDTVKLNGQGCE